ncbi:MAG: hypothetical protein DRJ01_06100 [Bacteroidetes bacterium]|nr:MAG: hypothetical protein DRJ01_06100 [Bacteroidota bacterium]
MKDVNDVLLINPYNDTTIVSQSELDLPTIFIVYGIGCGVCIKELNTIASKKAEWEQLYNVNFIVFCKKTKNRYYKQLAKMSEKKAYPFELFIDMNSDLAEYLSKLKNIDSKQFSSIGNFHLIIPQTIIKNKDNEIIFQKQGYQVGDEDKIEEVLKQMTKND